MESLKTRWHRDLEWSKMSFLMIKFKTSILQKMSKLQSSHSNLVWLVFMISKMDTHGSEMQLIRTFQSSILKIKRLVLFKLKLSRLDKIQKDHLCQFLLIETNLKCMDKTKSHSVSVVTPISDQTGELVIFQTFLDPTNRTWRFCHCRLQIKFQCSLLTSKELNWLNLLFATTSSVREKLLDLIYIQVRTTY